MKTLVLLFCHCGIPMPPPPFGECAFNHPVVITNLIWAVTVVLLGVFALCYLNKRMKLKKMMTDADRQHELALKDKSYVIEKRWYDAKKEEKQNEQLDNLKKEVNDLKNGDKIKEIEHILSQKEKEVDLLGKQLALYDKTFEKLKVELRTKETK